MNMNKFTMAVVGATLLASSLAGGSSAIAAEKAKITKVDMPIKLLYNARQLPTDVQPESVNGTTLVPLRVVSDKLGGKLTLTGKNIRIVKGKSTLSLTIGASTASINGKTTRLAVPVKVVKGRTLVPLRVVSEGLGVAVEWDSILQFVWIGSKDVPNIRDIRQPVDFEPYLTYFNDSDFLAKSGMGIYERTYIVDASDLPYKDDVMTTYRMDLAHDQNNHLYLQTIVNTRASMAPSYYYLSKQKPVVAYGLNYLTKIPKKGIHFYYNDTSKIGGTLNSLKKYEYFDVRKGLIVNSKEMAKVMMKNPWR
ncbi:copper amine oxidase N-terminal domain-containing protein [Paenibacillus rhizovicinus]|uniref:Copper amine oxidase N-terminal domain-containing protein n=1 Tax=Paenibacillus rhizovicinus TaxID=2704463 RepID=A0A6C0P4H8_9BACL|nr:copper amine oxidase N-terminal domain-containing protein [Paenibacillus rhizovicinus]QHW33399.1 copper amine oxidase N-terminal domain-containing protein [Paenibacillus rhizovicinus]